METAILIILAVLDVVLLGVVYVLGRRQIQPVDILRDLNEERRLLKELRQSVKEELEDGHRRSKEVLGRVSTIATEVEMEFRGGRDTLNKEMEEVLKEFSAKVEGLLGGLVKKQAMIEKLLKKVETEKTVLAKALDRGDKLARFFTQNVPYEEVLEEIEDKKYSDARELLSRGITPPEVAKYLGLPESEVKLIAAVR